MRRSGPDATKFEPGLERVGSTGRILTMRVTEKGQVTIPKDLRDALGIGAGSEIEFTREGSTLVVRKVSSERANRGQSLVERLRGRGDVKMTTDEIMALTRSDA
jgi:antitoxin PrlF